MIMIAVRITASGHTNENSLVTEQWRLSASMGEALLHLSSWSKEANLSCIVETDHPSRSFESSILPHVSTQILHNRKHLLNRTHKYRSDGYHLLFERLQLMMRWWIWLVWSVGVCGVWSRGLVGIEGAAFRYGPLRCRWSGKLVCESPVRHQVEQLNVLMGHWRTYQALRCSTEYPPECFLIRYPRYPMPII